LIPSRGKWFSFPSKCLDLLWCYPASYSRSNRGALSLGVKPYLMLKLTINGTTPPVPHKLYSVHRDFTFKCTKLANNLFTVWFNVNMKMEMWMNQIIMQLCYYVSTWKQSQTRSECIFTFIHSFTIHRSSIQL
jgi:hypothetical protein